MDSGIAAERLRAAVPVAVGIVAAIDGAATDQGRSLDRAVADAIKDGQDVEALVLALANMSHALVATLARQTGASVAALLAGMGEVGAVVDPPADEADRRNRHGSGPM